MLEIEDNEQAIIKNSRANLEKELPKLKDGTHVNGLIRLWERMEYEQASFTRINWDSLIPDFGEDIVNAAKNGIKVYWKSVAAIEALGKKSPGGNSIPWPAILGLSAIGLESQSREWATQLTKDDAKQATKIALFEINGLPKWIGNLYDVHPECVLEILHNCLEIESQGEGDSLTGSLWSIPEIILEKLVPYFLQSLEAGCFSQKLDDVVGILLRSDALDKKRLLQLAQKRFEEIKEPFWLATLFHLDSRLALNELTAYIQEIPNQIDSFIQLVLGAIAPTVFSDRGAFRRSKYKDYLEHRDVVFDLTCLAYTHIRLRDDVDHMSGGSWTPDSRDYAEEARGYFLKKTYGISGRGNL